MVAVPTVHMNGTSYDELVRQARDASKAVRSAADALRGMSPNGRDYYPQGDEALRTATDEHRERMNKLAAIQDELTDIAIGIVDQKRR